MVKETKDGRALVALGIPLPCAGCAGKQAPAEGPEKSKALVWAKNSAAAQTGDRVAVSVPELKPGLPTIAFYALPLSAILLGAGIGKWVSSQAFIFQALEARVGNKAASLILTSDNPSLVLGLIFLLTGFLAVRVWAKRLMRGVEFQPDLVRVLGEEDGKAD